MQILQNSSLLVHFYNSKKDVLACDAQLYGLGAVLLQVHNTCCLAKFLKVIVP